MKWLFRKALVNAHKGPIGIGFSAECNMFRCLSSGMGLWVGALALLVGLMPSADAEMPLPSVSIAAVETAAVTEWREFTGRLTAVDEVALRPRVSGQIQKVHFQEGAIAQKGDLLFQIDDRPFTALLNQAKAEYNRADTQYQQAFREAKRGKELLRRKVISKEENELRLAASAATLAQREAASAALELAKLNVAFTRVIAPVSGRLGLAEITEGNWVQAGQTVLTTMVAADRLTVDFAVDERTFLLFGKHWQAQKTQVKVGLIADDGYPYSARLSFIDNQVNAQTGTIQLRATLVTPNALRPGFFARVSVPTAGPYQGILINDRAVATDQGARYVLKVDEHNVAQYIPVVLGPKFDGLRVVRSGLEPGASIIVKGLMRARPGAPVMPEIVDMRQLEPIDKVSDYSAGDGDEKYLSAVSKVSLSSESISPSIPVSVLDAALSQTDMSDEPAPPAEVNKGEVP